MKTALDFYARGKQKEVYADEYNRSCNYSKGRFICLECGENVFLKKNKNSESNIFSHYKKEDYTVECEKRSDSAPTDSVYKKVGLPIYIMKNRIGDFELYMGFKALPLSILEKAIENSIVLNIDDRTSYIINEEHFLCDDMTLIQLEYAPRYRDKYTITYKPVEDSRIVEQHWSDYADGFSKIGAFFKVSENAGKKIRRGDYISTDEEYYWVCNNSYVPVRMSGMKIEEAGKIYLKNSEMKVFKVRFLSSISDEDFNKLSLFLIENFKICLLEKKPDFEVIWPPVRKKEDGYIIREQDKNIYGYVSSGNDIPKAYVFESIIKEPNYLKIEDKLARIDIKWNETLVNVDRKYVSRGIVFLTRKRSIIDNNTSVYRVVDEKYISLEEKYLLEKSSDIVLMCNHEIEYVLVRDNKIIDNKCVIGECYFDKLNNGDVIYVLQQSNLLSTINVYIENIIFKRVVSDLELYNLFKKYNSTKKVMIPYILRFELYKLSKNKQKSKQYIEKALRDNYIPEAIVKVLEEMTNEQ